MWFLTAFLVYLVKAVFLGTVAFFGVKAGIAFRKSKNMNQ
ncbi:hypothetical protein SAMN05661086_02888 [Anaeromicropila populeti]|uniref:Uncharacterized protein n=1 Tax=Anaeromicropila populeti TaxID=37658 RepID=A0A1I6KZ20_9FIRM|nr:hypothetical protein SAMN05661086_02888 [Anaeromicropila populeti]